MATGKVPASGAIRHYRRALEHEYSPATGDNAMDAHIELLLRHLTQPGGPLADAPLPRLATAPGAAAGCLDSNALAGFEVDVRFAGQSGSPRAAHQNVHPRPR